jgi:hypothetical protein
MKIDLRRTEHDTEYDRMDILPRWGYTDSEYIDLVLSASKIIDGTFYVKIEPKIKSETEILFEEMMK